MKQNILMPITTFMTTSYHNSKTSFRSYLSPDTYILILAGILFLCNSCEEDGTIIGNKMLPGSDFVTLYSTDTLNINSYTMYTDSIESDNPGYSYLGELYDPYFGSTTAGFVTQIRMNDLWGGGVLTVDSIKLVLNLTNVVGDTSAGHILTISEIAEEIYTDTMYYSNKKTPLTGYSIDVPLPGLKADTINEFTLTLPTSFGEYIIRDTTMLFHSNSVPDFRSYFKGLQFTLRSTGDPVFLTLSLTPPDSYSSYSHYFVIYLRDEDDVTSVFFFILDAKARNACYNIYSHDYSTAQADKKIEHINDGFRDTLAYQQCMSGVFTKFTIPGLDDIKNDTSLKGIKINKARITWPVHYDGYTYYGSSFPSQLYIGYYDNTGSKYLIHDYYISKLFFDGEIDTTAGNYSFNLAYYVQQFLEDSTNVLKPEFQLILPAGSVQNALLKANDSASPIKFDLTYTRF
jgi:hypothetical protein